MMETNLPIHIKAGFALANRARIKSPDLSTQVGAAIIQKDGSVVSVDTNRFPKGIEVTPTRLERPIKYQYIEHAERNAIYNASKMYLASTEGAVMCMIGMGPPTIPCIECAKAIIAAGITDVYGIGYKPVPEHWLENFILADELLKEAGIIFHEVDPSALDFVLT